MRRDRRPRPPRVSRRRVLGQLAAGGFLLAGGPLNTLFAAGAPARLPECGPDPFAGAAFLDTLPLTGQGAVTLPFHQLLGRGLDARLVTDLSRLRPDRLITPTNEFYIRTSYPDRLQPPDPWIIRVGGAVGSDQTLRLDDLRSDEGSRGVSLMECAGNANPADFGLMSAAGWTGIPLDRVLERTTPLTTARRILISGADQHSTTSRRSTPGASWIFTPDELAEAGAFLATGMNDEALTPDHGAPVRLVVPGWYGAVAVKWVNEIRWVGDDEPATAHMREFAARTHQQGIPPLAREFAPAIVRHAAMPVRVERWRVGEDVMYRVVGILWGGRQVTDRLQIRFTHTEPYEPVAVCPAPETTRTWTLWSHAWRPRGPGRYRIVLRIDDQEIPTPRLDIYFYARDVWIA